MSNFIATHDATVLQTTTGSGSYGNSRGPNMWLGRIVGGLDNYSSHIILAIPCTFGTTAVTVADLRLKVVAASCFGQGTAPRFWVERMTSTFTEKSTDVSTACGFTATDSNGWSQGSSGSTTNRAEYSGTPSAGTWLRISIKNMVEAFRAERALAGATTGTLYLRLVPSNGSGGYDEDGSTRHIVFATLNSGTANAAYIETTYATAGGGTPPPPPGGGGTPNVAPLAPVNVTPHTLSGGDPQVYTSTNGRSVVFSAAFMDPGDTIKAVRVKVLADGAVSPSEAAIMLGTGLDAGKLADLTYTVTTSPFYIPIDGFEQHTTYRHVIMTMDSKGAWGPWSDIADGRFITNGAPRMPANTFFQNDTTQDNLILARLDDPDPDDFISAHEIEVYYYPAAGARQTMWAPGRQAIGGESNILSVNYGGTQLTPLYPYLWRIRLYDSLGAPSPWFETTFIPYDKRGPYQMTPSGTATKLNTRTPTLSVLDAEFDQITWEVYDNAEGTGTPLWKVALQNITPAVTFTRVYGDNFDLSNATTATALQWGGTYWWRAAIRIVPTTSIGAWSPMVPFYVNALPAAPLVTVGA